MSKFGTCVYADYFAEYSMRACNHPANKSCEAHCRGCTLYASAKNGLEKCLFCRSSDVSLHDEYGDGVGRTKWQVHCHKCGADGPVAYDAQKAKDLWNVVKRA